MTQPELALALVGFGNVARRFVRLLDEVARSTRLHVAARRHRAPAITAASSIRTASTPRARRRSSRRAQSLDRLDPAPRERERHRRRPPGHRSARATKPPTAAWSSSRRRRSTSIAASRRSATSARRSRAGRTWSPPTRARRRSPIDELERAGRLGRIASFLFEGAVMDGVPVFNLVARDDAGDRRRAAFAASSTRTCHYILSRWNSGVPFDDALARCRRAASPRPTRRSTSTAGTRRPRPRRWSTC